jgi:hypothetical protein
VNEAGPREHQGVHELHLHESARGDAHLFQHQIHHRGQAHAMLSGTSAAPPQLGEVAKPHVETVAKLAQRLGVKPDDIETY